MAKQPNSDTQALIDLRATVDRGVELLTLCQKLQSLSDGVDRPVPFSIDKSKTLDAFARDIGEAITYHQTLRKLVPMSERLAEVGRALETKKLVTVIGGEDYAEVALRYFERQSGSKV